MHKYGTVQTDDIFVHLRHGAPPIIFQIILELYTVGPIVIGRTEPIIDFAGLINEAVLFAVRDDILELIRRLCHGLFFFAEANAAAKRRKNGKK